MLISEHNQVTVAYNPSEKNQDGIRDIIAGLPGINLVPAHSLTPKDNIPFLRISPKGLSLKDGDQLLFFHPSMSLLRLLNIIRGKGDRFLQASGLNRGDSFLDGTMGLASDTLIAAWAVGERGKILALESSPLIYALVSDGLKRLKMLSPPDISNTLKQQAWLELSKASGCIEAYLANHLEFLKQMPDSSVDIIYFDPMFRITRAKSSSIQPVKTWSNPDPLQLETIAEARRVARRRIVLKERKNSPEFLRLGFKITGENKYSPVNFGVIDLSKSGRCLLSNL